MTIEAQYSPADLPGRPEHAEPTPSVGVILKGTFAAPDFRGEDGDLRLTDGEPRIGVTYRLPFLLALPADEGMQPFPAVILQHGQSGRKEFVAFVAEQLAARGLAVAPIDAVGHGENPAQGSIMSFFDAPVVRGSFMQTTANLFTFVRAFDEPGGLDANNDGVGDLDLDAPFGLLGESLGGITGGSVVALEPRVRVAVLNVAGGGLSGVTEAVFGAMFDDSQELAVRELESVMQAFLDAADPVSFWRSASTEGPDNAARPQILMQSVVGDTLIAAPHGAETLAFAFDLPYVCPCPQQIPLPSLRRSEAPQTERGIFYYEDAMHGFLLAETEVPQASEAVHRQAAEFFASFYETGTALVADPL